MSFCVTDSDGQKLEFTIGALPGPRHLLLVPQQPQGQLQNKHWNCVHPRQLFSWHLSPGKLSLLPQRDLRVVWEPKP